MNSTLRRRLAYGSNATLVTILLITTVILLYVVLEPYRVRVDLSADQGSVLMADTANKLRLLQADGETVTITAFSAQEGKKEAYFKNRALRDLVEELDYASPIVESQFVDFDRERLTAERLGVTEYGTVVIQRGDARVDLKDRELFRRVGKGADKALEFLGETAINQAFSQLMSDSRRTIYALVGHGELDPEDREPGGLAELAAAARQEHYDLKRLDLLRAEEAPRIPDDAAGVLVLRPRVPLTAVEEDLLLGWVASGGGLMMAVEPQGVVPSALGRVGVVVPDGLVLDKLLVFPYKDRPVPRYRNHIVTQALADELLVTVLAGVAPLQASVPPLEGVRSTTLLETSRDGWIERGGALLNGEAQFEPEIDTKGPAAMALALELSRDSGLVKRGTARVLVLGDADVFSNALLAEGPGNVTFAVNCLRWLVGDDGRLSMVGRPQAVRRLTLSSDDLAALRWVVIGLGPMLAVVLGAAMWARRRGR